MSDDHIGVKINGIIYVKLDDVKPMRDRIEKLEAANLQQSLIKVDDMQRIEKLEAALREIAASAWDCNGATCEHCQPNSCQNALIARKALEGKDD